MDTVLEVRALPTWAAVCMGPGSQPGSTPNPAPLAVTFAQLPNLSEPPHPELCCRVFNSTCPTGAP